MRLPSLIPDPGSRKEAPGLGNDTRDPRFGMDNEEFRRIAGEGQMDARVPGRLEVHVEV